MGNGGAGYHCGGDCDYDSCEYTWIMEVIDMTVVVMVMRTVVDTYG